jgi:hypothetical protein
MAADLYPTKTRLALLRQVANSQVMTDPTAEHHHVVLFPDAPDVWANRVTVTARIDELERAGWVVDNEAEVFWHPTEAGLAVLAAADGRQPA